MDVIWEEVRSVDVGDDGLEVFRVAALDGGGFGGRGKAGDWDPFLDWFVFG